ncbi:MAG: zinc metallopeptidase [Lachnospiraceae bacterium]|nr:zinc metallopeptidase [Lachnospiraceae bacterium]
MSYYRYYWDPTYVLVLIGALLSIMASAHVKSVFQKYSRIGVLSGATGRDTAETLLNRAGIYDVSINAVAGSLTDNFNPRNMTVNLSEPVYGGRTISAVSVAAHECGHAMQHHNRYAMLAFRSALVPVANIGSKIGIPIILVGMLFSAGGAGSILTNIGIWCFSLSVLFQLVTLPVEFNASSRALAALKEQHLLEDSELAGAKKVLSAAALTYVASAAASILTLLRLIMIFGGNRRRD